MRYKNLFLLWVAGLCFAGTSARAGVIVYADSTSLGAFFRGVTGNGQYCEDYYSDQETWPGIQHMFQGGSVRDLSKIKSSGSEPLNQNGEENGEEHSWTFDRAIRSVNIQAGEVVVLYDEVDFKGKLVVLIGSGCYDLSSYPLDTSARSIQIYRNFEEYNKHLPDAVKNAEKPVFVLTTAFSQKK